jgi:hypothetical protein
MMAPLASLVTPVALPAESAITRAYSRVNLADAYAVALPAGTVADPEVLARFLFSQQPPWVAGLMALRDGLVSLFGLKTGKALAALGEREQASRVGIFKIYSRSPTEIVLGEDDNHLDFRLSVLCPAASAPGAERRLVLSTVVHCHNRLGRAYILLIAPFHRRIVQASLRRAALQGWPRETAG